MTNRDNAHIEKYLDYYLFNAESSNFSKDILTQRRKVDYAVLITGGWGSGKTYFIDAYLNERRANIISKDIYERPFEIIKISLFGISSCRIRVQAVRKRPPRRLQSQAQRKQRQKQKILTM